MTELTEAKKDFDIRQRIRDRVSLVKNRLKLPVSASTAAAGIADYVNVSQKNPKLSHYRILQKLSAQKRDAVSAVNSALPIPMIVNAPDTQLRRALRDTLREEKMNLNEEFNPPAMLLLKRQAIRLFPNGQRVALYMDNKYGLTFPVPYDTSGAGFGAALNTVSSGPIGTAKTGGPIAGYVNEEYVPVLLSTGEEIPVERSVMTKIHEVYESLNEENKQKFSDMLLENEETFNKAKEFALNVK